MLENLIKGQIINYGKFPQNRNGEIEEIKWKVIDVKNKKALLICTKALYYFPFNIERREVTWEDSSLRHVLNTAFFNLAFSKNEQEMILHSKITTGNIVTNDQIFILSAEEAQTFFENDSERMCQSTELVNKLSINRVTNDNGNCWWWLRTSAENGSKVCDVNHYGHIDNNGGIVDGDCDAVRPALWIRTTSSRCDTFDNEDTHGLLKQIKKILKL